VDAMNSQSEVPIGARVRRDQNRETQTDRLPDGTLGCPARSPEVEPLGASSTPSGSGYHSEAYWAGWMDGRFRETGSFVRNPNLARWAAPSERIDYYRGHRTGSEARRRGSSGLLKAHERSSGRTRP
jgi:hypothetical protein